MNKKTAFRRANNEEKNQILETVKINFGDSCLKAFSDSDLWIKEGNIKEVFILKKHVSELIEKIPHQIDFSGIPIGSFTEKLFNLEIEGAKLILPFTDKIVKVKTEQYLYGKPIFVENIEYSPKQFKKRDWLIIIGKEDLHYGIGQVEISKDNLSKAKPNSIFLRGYKNKPRDRGWYLRKEK